MRTQQKDIVEEKSIPDNAHRVSLPEKNNDKVIRDYQREIYSDVKSTIVRELASNAIDAHDEAGVDRNIEIELNSSKYLGEETPVFITRDYGTGMSKEFVLGPFTEYRTSTKNDSNDLIGGWGIGAKSPLGYRNKFTVVSYYNGTKTKYLLQRDQDGDFVVPIHQEKTDRTNGVTIIVPIEQGDLNEFKEACFTELAYFSDRITFLGDAPEVRLPEAKIENEHIRAAEKGVKMTHQRYADEAWDGLHIVVGGVPYDLETDSIPELDGRASRLSESLALKFEVGEVDLNLPRERLQYSKKTKEAIAEKLEEDVLPSLDSFIADALSEFEAENYIEEQLKIKALSNYSNFASIDTESIKEASIAISIRKRIDSNFKGKTSADLGDGTIKSITRDGFERSYLIDSEDKSADNIDKMLSGKWKNVFYSTKSSDAPTNRYIVENYRGAWVYFFDDDEGEFFDCFSNLFDSYDDLDFDRSEYKVAHGDDEIPAYYISESKVKRNYEDVDQITDEESDVQWIYGFQEDIGSLKEFKEVVAPLVNWDSSGYKVRRVSKANARKYFGLDNHSHIRDIDTDAMLQEAKEFFVPQYHLLCLAKDNSWMSKFSNVEHGEPFYKLWKHVQNATTPIRSRGIHQKIPRYASDWKYRVRKWYKNADDSEKTVSPELSTIVRRLKHYSEKLQALKPAMKRSYRGSSETKSIEKLLKPIESRMTDVPDLDTEQFGD